MTLPIGGNDKAAAGDKNKISLQIQVVQRKHVGIQVGNEEHLEDKKRNKLIGLKPQS